MIKRNMVATIVVSKELEINVKTTDDSDNIILELPVPKAPVSIKDLREAIEICELFVSMRGDQTQKVHVTADTKVFIPDGEIIESYGSDV